MHKIAAAIALSALLLSGAPSDAQTSTPVPRHRVVFEITTDSPEAWEAVLNNVENVKKAFGREPVDVEVVTHGKGLDLLVEAKNQKVRDRLKKNADAGVVFAACQNTMQRKNLKKEHLSTFATTVDSGVAEVVRKQEASWAYLKSG